MSIDPTPRILPLPPPPPPIRWGDFIGGLVFALIIGGLLNLVAVSAGSITGSRILPALLGTIPGLGFVLLSKTASRMGFGQGMLVGGFVIALIGGACGATLNIN